MKRHSKSMNKQTHFWKYNIYVQIKYKCVINIVGTCKLIYIHRWPAIFNLVDFLHWTNFKCKCTFCTYAGVKGQLCLMLLKVAGVCVQAVTEAYCKQRTNKNKQDCLGNTTDCDLEDIPGTVSLFTEHTSHVPSRTWAMTLTLRQTKPSHLFCVPCEKGTG